MGRWVQGEPPGPLGRVVAEHERHPAVGDLVEDDRRDQDREEDDLEACEVHGRARALALGGAVDAEPGGRLGLEARR